MEKNEALPEVLGNAKRTFISGEQGNKSQILRVTGNMCIFGEEIGEQTNFRETREQVPHTHLGEPQEWHRSVCG